MQRLTSRLTITLFSFVALIGLAAGYAQAGLIGLSSTNPGVLYDVDSATGVATTKVTLIDQGASATGLEYLGGTFYATDIYPAFFRFGSIDINSGVFTVINDQDGSANWHGLAGSESAGLLYAIDINDGDKLKSITPAGVVTTIGSGTGIDGRGMAFDDSGGILYATGSGATTSLNIVDTTTGVATPIGGTGINSILVGLAFDPSNNTLYMIADPGNDGSSILYTLDVTTGAATMVGSTGVTGAPIDGLAFVPEPTSFVLAVFSLVGIIGLGWRRKRSA